VVVLQPSYEGVGSDFKGLDTQRDLTPLVKKSYPDAEVEHAYLRKASVNLQVKNLKGDVFINLCNGSWDEELPAIEVVMALEKEGKAFTGADSSFYEPTRESMKKFCVFWGINTPRHVFAYDNDDVQEAILTLNFPLFVKHYCSYNSIGITKDCKVRTPEQLKEQFAVFKNKYGGALIEEFVDGREFSVLVVSNPANERDPLVFPPVECVFENPEFNFKTFDIKWANATASWVPLPDEKIIAKLYEIAKRVFTSFKGNGYGRIDFRMDAKEDIYFLEINPNCSIFYHDEVPATADMILMLEGTGKAGMLRHMIEFGLKRQRENTPIYKTRLDPVRGHSMIALRDIRAGERIYKVEETPQILVSKDYVASNFDQYGQELVRHYAYPVSGDLSLIWPSDPKDWKPIGHSCDPNAWFTGLDLYARRDISKGQAIVIDYATVHIQDPVNFKCDCGEKLCRGGWKGEDFLQPWFHERYGDHVSSFVKEEKRKH